MLSKRRSNQYLAKDMNSVKYREGNQLSTNRARTRFTKITRKPELSSKIIQINQVLEELISIRSLKDIEDISPSLQDLMNGMKINKRA